jgi:hypothetical protein
MIAIGAQENKDICSPIDVMKERWEPGKVTIAA